MKYMPPTLISENLKEIRIFFKKHKAVVAKPINGFSGNNVILFRSFNNNKIIKLLKTHNHLFDENIYLSKVNPYYKAH